jgi:P-type conjugative transfer protein TrbJ
MNLKSIRIRSLAGILTATVLLSASVGAAGFPVIDISNLAQSVLNVARQTQQVTQGARNLTQQAQQIQHEIDMLRDMARNSAGGRTAAWGDLQAVLGSLSRVLQIGQSISYTLRNVDSAYRQRFPGYSAPNNWLTQYDQWSRTTLDTLAATLAAAGANASDAASIDASLQSLRTANEGAQGRLEAIQIGTQVASLQVAELAKLRQLVAAQINAENAYLGAQEAKESGAAAAFDGWVASGPRAIATTRPAEGFAVVPRP